MSKEENDTKSKSRFELPTPVVIGLFIILGLVLIFGVFNVHIH